MRPPSLRLGRDVLKYGALGAIALGGSACQSMPAAHSGYLSTYAGLGEAADPARPPRARRDDPASDAITTVYIEPSVLYLLTESPLSPEDQTMVRQEVDRQICYEVSERFTLIPEASADAGRVRTAIVQIHPTNRAGSAFSAATGFFIPVPIVKFRVPMTTGGLAVESEMLAPDGTQVAALTWSRRAEVVGRMDPSLSPVGDALQLAEPLGDAVGDAFSSKDRAVRPIPDPDPCARFGARTNVGRMLASGIVGFGTGLYVPSVAGAGAPATAAEAPPPAEE